MTSMTNKLTAAAVLLFIAVAGAASLINAVISGDKDNIAALPENSGQGYGSELEAAAAEKFAGRDGWIAFGSRVDSAMKGNIVNGVYVADDRLISAEGVSRKDLSRSVGYINSFTQAYDGAVYFAAVPTSAGVYGDKLPEHISRGAEKQLIDKLCGGLDTSIRCIDAYDLMKMMSDERIYFRSDTKWTMYGAYCVYRTVIQKLGSQPVSYDKYHIRHVTDQFYGDLYRKTLYMKCEPDILDIYEYPEGAEVLSCTGYDNDGYVEQVGLYDEEALESDDMYSLYLGGEYPLVRIRTDLNNDRHILVIGSRCAASFVPFLIQHYSEVTFVRPELMDRPLSDFLYPDDYEQTLFLFGIDSVTDSGLKYIEMR